MQKNNFFHLNFLLVTEEDKSGIKSYVPVCNSIHNVRITSIGAKHIGEESMRTEDTCSARIFLTSLDHLCPSPPLMNLGNKSPKSPIAQTPV